jgi:hypothetical protein
LLRGAIAAFIAALCMSVLVRLGFWHARRTTNERTASHPMQCPRPNPTN